MRLIFLIFISLFSSAAFSQMWQPVDPDKGPVAGEVYVDVERLNRARMEKYDSIDQLIDSKASDFTDVGFDLTSVPLSQAIQVYFSEVARSPYVICSDVLSDNRMVSLRASGPALNRAMLTALLEANGLSLNFVGGVATVCTKPPELTEEQKAARRGKVFVYRPKNRSVSDLVRLASPLVIGVFANNNSGSGVALAQLGGRSSSASPTHSLGDADEVLVFSGESVQVARLKKILEALDSQVSSVMVRAVLYEVAESDQSSSALKIISDLLKGHVGISIGGGISPLANTLSVATSSFDFVASAISEDARFRILTSPFLRVQNGSSARFQVGEDVPVMGDILFNPNGQSSQSVKYLSSGVIFDVGARMMGDTIGLSLTQTVSNFVKTTVGNNDNPTLNKRELQTSLTLRNGEIVILGGLSDDKNSDSRNGLFGFNFAKSKSSSSSQLVLLLQAERV